MPECHGGMEWGPVLPRGRAGCAVVPTAEKMPPAVLSVSAGARVRLAVEAVGCVRRLPLRLASAAAADGGVPQCPAAARLLRWCLGRWDSTPVGQHAMGTARHCCGRAASCGSARGCSEAVILQGCEVSLPVNNRAGRLAERGHVKSSVPFS